MYEQQAQSHGFDIVHNGADLLHKIDHALSNLEHHRLQNFYGAMLRQHLHRSTEFMSRWIEVKNKL